MYTKQYKHYKHTGYWNIGFNTFDKRYLAIFNFGQRT